MRFLFDENLPPAIAVALRDLRQPVTSVHLLDLRGISDEELLPRVAAEQAHLVTGDPAMLRNEARVAQFKALGLSAFLVRDGMASGLEKARLIFRCWPDMVRRAEAAGAPFFAELSPTGRAVRDVPPGRRLR